MVEIESGCEDRPCVAYLEPSDGELLGRMFRRLSAQSIYRRFFSPITRPDSFQASLLHVDHRDREAVAGVVGGEIVGVAQYMRTGASSQAEMAIVVADDWQRQGLGTRLVTALADRARAAGIDEFAVDIQGENYGALRLLKRIAPGVRLTFSGGVGETVIPLRPRDGHE